MKIDLHVHTVYSNDSLTPLRDVLRWAVRRQLGAVAITDHDTIEGACSLSRTSPVPIIVGEEILTQRGEVIGLFLQEEIPPCLSSRETVSLIHQQGGLVYVPHPLDRLRRSAIGYEGLMEIIDEVDIIEALNARVTLGIDNQLAGALARRHGLPCGAGSDAHYGFEVGRAYVEIPALADTYGLPQAETFLESLRQGEPRGRISSPLVHVGSAYAKVAKELMPFAHFAR